MKDYRLFLIDLDGTIYRGKETVASGVRFVHRLDQAQKNYLFLTNNTTRTPQMVVDKLRGHGVITDSKHIYTPSMATVSYILSHRKTRAKIGVYIIGEIGLWSELLNHPAFEIREHHPDYVIVGMDTDLTYHKVRVATKAIREGAVFIGTNADMNLPLGNELIPGNGSQCAMIEAASGQKPIYIGKPAAIIVNMALKKLGFTKQESVLVGDNYDTDIKAGFNSHVDQILTLTGVTRRTELAGKKPPTIVVNNLDEYRL